MVVQIICFEWSHAHVCLSEARTNVGRNEYIKWASEVGAIKNWYMTCTYTRVSDEVSTPNSGTGLGTKKVHCSEQKTYIFQNSLL